MLAITGCNSAAGPNPGANPTATSTPKPPTTFTMKTPKGGVDALLTKDAVAFTAKGGAIDSVEVTRADGAPLTTTADDAGLVATWTRSSTTWQLKGVLGPKTAYRAKVTGHNADGAKASKTFAFTTKAAPLVQTRMNPGDDQVVGVGMPIQVRFSTKVPNRALVERRLTVTTKPAVTGSWGWLDDRTVMWRPKDFWPAGTKVDAAVDLTGQHLGKGVFGGTKRTIAFSVGRDLRMSIDNASHSMTVTQAGKQVQRFPVSLGKPGHTTRSGTKIIYEKATPYTMRGTTAADPYVTTVKHAQRITDSGEFLHGAPWSVGAQGRRNVSHGCTNLSPGAAAWLYGRTIMGDPVITKGTGRQAETWNGLGGIWNYSWADWQKQSAITPKKAKPSPAKPVKPTTAPKAA